MQSFIDLRSDTVTRPTSGMRALGVLATVGRRTRLATHLDAPREKLERALHVFRDYRGWHA
jgi:hypothetical protein